MNPTRRQDSSTLPVSDGPFLAVGLGNPGAEYEGTRHNVGAMVVEHVVAQAGERWKSKSGAHIAQLRIAAITAGEVSSSLSARTLICARLGSYMNLSGQQTAALAKYFKIPAANVLVLHDDLDLDFGRLRLKIGGGEGGHNGLRSISAALGTKNYMRLRLGIGRPPGRQNPADYVLRRFAKAEQDDLDLLVNLASDTVEEVVKLGLTEAQMRLHSRE